MGSSRGNPETIKAYAARHWKLSRYGLTPEMFAALVVAQTGRCGICVRPLTDNLRIDHDHVTGRVRGLLCQGCNTGLGLLADGVAGLRAALDYLERAET